MRDLRRKRLAAGLSRKQLAAAIGVSERQLASWERRRAVPRARWYPRLAATLNISVDQVVAMFADACDTCANGGNR